jgi:hypothetical protein
LGAWFHALQRAHRCPDCRRSIDAFQFIAFTRLHDAALEQEKIAKRTQRGRYARVQSGKLNAAYISSFKYRWASPDTTKSGKWRLVLDPDAAPVVRTMYDLAIDGAPLREIASQLTERGIPTPSDAARLRETTTVSPIRLSSWAIASLELTKRRNGSTSPTHNWVFLQ